jgi:hypothetical protein
MTLEHVERTVTTAVPTPAGTPMTTPATPVSTANASVRTEQTTMVPGRPELGRRITVLVFGLIQLLIGVRIVLLILDAREGNALVSGILNLSQLFVAPFEGILRSDALHSGGSTFDIAAVVAIVGWTVLEFVVIKALAVFRRETV